jgi:hypothetical protein
MGVRGNNWYNLQSTRRYPLDDRATGTGDDGTRIKDDVLVDCQLRFPNTYGEYAYISGITITERLVTVTILAASSPTATTGFIPLAAVSLVKPVQRHTYYPITALQPGVGGFLVFGDVEERLNVRFTTPQQGLLLPKCAAAYQPLPIPTLRKLGRSVGLAGLVRILPGSDIAVSREIHEINGQAHAAMVFRLTQSIATRNVLEVYRGPCDNRPESRTCDKEGIEFINGVGPDCDGNIDIIFVGLTPAPYTTCATDAQAAGVTLDQSVGIDEVCAPRTPGRFAGRDYCEPSSESSLSSASLSEESESASSDSGSETSESLSSESCTALPFTRTFDAATARGFDVVQGAFTFESLDSPDEEAGGPDVSYVATNTTRRNVSVLTDCGIDNALNKRVTTHVSLQQSQGRSNGHLVLNYRLVDPINNPHFEYFAVALDRQAGKIRLLRWAGAGFIEEAAAVVGSPILYDDWYELEAEIEESDGQAAIGVAVRGITDPGWPDVSFSVLTSKYVPSDGLFGVGSDRALASFSFLKIEELP